MAIVGDEDNHCRREASVGVCDIPLPTSIDTLREGAQPRLPRTLLERVQVVGGVSDPFFHALIPSYYAIHNPAGRLARQPL